MQKLVIMLCNIFKTRSARSCLTTELRACAYNFALWTVVLHGNRCSCIRALHLHRGERNLSHERNLAQELVSVAWFSPWISTSCKFTSWKMAILNKKPIKIKAVAAESSKIAAPNLVLNFIQGTFPLTIFLRTAAAVSPRPITPIHQRQQETTCV